MTHMYIIYIYTLFEVKHTLKWPAWVRAAASVCLYVSLDLHQSCVRGELREKVKHPQQWSRKWDRGLAIYKPCNYS